MFDKVYARYKELFFYSIVAIIVGIATGVFMGIFGRMLYMINGIRDPNIRYLLPFLPIAGLFIVYAFQKYSYESSKGIFLIFKTGIGERDDIPKVLIPLIVFATSISTLFGASTGREGAAVQIGASLSYSIAKRFKFIPDKSIFIVIGIAAGFAGLFRTPLGATIFALEVMVAGILMYEALFPSLLAAFTANAVSGLFGLNRMSFNIDPNYILDFNIILFIKIIILGMIFGFAGSLFPKAINFFKDVLGENFPNPRKKIFIVGIFLAILLYVFHYGRYSAAGDGLLKAAFVTGDVYKYDWVVKLLLTALSIAIGFHGGEVVPLFSIGSTLGFVIAPLFGLPNDFVAALGLIAVFSSASGTVLSPIILAMEIFNNEYAFYFGVIACVSYAFHGYKTIYSAQERYTFFSQKILLKKTADLNLNLDINEKK